jgi:hypothetical protein
MPIMLKDVPLVGSGGREHASPYSTPARSAAPTTP